MYSSRRRHTRWTRDWSSDVCSSDLGYRVNEEALSVLIGDLHISEVTRFSISEARQFFESLELTTKEKRIANLILKEIEDRLTFLDRKSTRLNSSHVAISYAVFCLKKKNNK